MAPDLMLPTILGRFDPYPVLGPATAAVSHGVGQQKAVTSWGQVEYSLSYDKAHPEENVTGRQERDNQQHQTQGKRPGGGRERSRNAKGFNTRAVWHCVVNVF